MMEVTVRCGCKRIMRPDTYAGPGHYRCGCGARVGLSGLPKFDAGHCPLPRGNRACNGPKLPDYPLCEQHMVMVSRLAVHVPEIMEQLAEDLASVDFRRAHQDQLEKRRAEERARSDAYNQREQARKVCVVYYCLLRPGVVKIGTSVQLAARVDSFRLSASAVLAAEPGHFRLENLRHRQFPAQRIDPEREDFRLDDELQAHIDKVRAQHGDPYELVTRIYENQRRLAEDPNSELPFVKVAQVST